MAGGSYLVARKIRMVIESWDRTRLEEQQRVIGREKGEGAPLSGGTEFTEPDFDKPDDDGSPRIAEDAHVRLAHPDANGGARLLRRGYNFVDGNDALGRLDAGLFFLSFQRDPGAVHRRAAQPRGPRRPQRVHQARRLGDLRDPAGRDNRAAPSETPCSAEPEPGLSPS